MDRKENRKSIVTSGYFYTLAGKTKLKVFEGEFEGELFSKSSALNKSLVTLLYEYHTYETAHFLAIAVMC